MIFQPPEDYVSDYAGSEHFLFLAPAIKEHAEGVLCAFFDRAALRGADTLEALTTATVEAVLLQDMGKLSLPAEAKKAVPEALEGFFGWLKASGRFPAAGSWQVCAEALGDRFRVSLREDGSAKGETYRKASTEIGRNDPCFCGSGRKYKKCCGA